jgi:hypothetical protein
MIQLLVIKGNIKAYHLYAGRPMTPSSEAAKILQAALAGTVKVSRLISALPVEQRASALGAAEHRYLQMAMELGCDKKAGQNWVATIMNRLHANVEIRVFSNRRLLKNLHEELVRVQSEDW